MNSNLADYFSSDEQDTPETQDLPAVEAALWQGVDNWLDEWEGGLA